MACGLGSSLETVKGAGTVSLFRPWQNRQQIRVDQQRRLFQFPTAAFFRGTPTPPSPSSPFSIFPFPASGMCVRELAPPAAA